MKIGNDNLNINDAIDFADNESIILKRRKNNLLLSDFQVSVLKNNGIYYEKYDNLQALLFDIEQQLNNYYDKNLDLVSSQLSEIIYYNYTNK